MKLCPVCGEENTDTAQTCKGCEASFDPSELRRKTVVDTRDSFFLRSDSFISERYRIVRELGKGGMGVVYLVKDTKLNDRLVALKMIHMELVSHQEARQRFKDEVILCLDMSHSNIVRIHPLEEWDHLLYFTMEYIQGQSLRELLSARKDRCPPFSLEETAQVTGQILDALSYAHQTTIHRDIKPENIMIQGKFPDIRVKVLDFGIAKVLSASRFTRTAQSMGTAYYMSPEQMQGAGRIDLRSDLYSVGMILYEMLTGKIAAGRFKLPSEMIPDFFDPVDGLIETCLSPEPGDRHENAAKMKSALTDCLARQQEIAKEKEDVRQKQEKQKQLEQEAADEQKQALEKQKQAENKEQEETLLEKEVEDVPAESLKTEKPRKKIPEKTQKKEPAPDRDPAARKKNKLGYLVAAVVLIVAMLGGGQLFLTGPGTKTSVGPPISTSAPPPSSPGAGDVWKEPVTGMEFVWVPKGCYKMGCGPWTSQCSDDEKPLHDVCLDGFWIGKHEVTQGQWKKITGSNPSRFKSGDVFPVEQVSWNDAKQFITRLNQQSGRRFALPTEAQWEYAARSGGREEKYAGSNDVDRVAWYSGNSGSKTHRVGTIAPNGLGIYDMSGNVWEWCEDVYDKNVYSSHDRGNNPVVASGGTARVFRGGSWNNDSGGVRAAGRFRNTPGNRYFNLGFRLSLPQVGQQ